MFVRVLSCSLCALLASPASAEFVVQDGDYYEELTDFGVGIQSIRITGGRVDRLLGFGGSSTVTIEGGSIGTIRSGGNLELHLRGGGFQIDNPILFDDGPMGDSDAISIYLEDVYTFDKREPAPGQWKFAAWYSDFTYAEVSFVAESQFPGVSVTDFWSTIDKPLGDTQGDGMIDLQDLNNLRNLFGGFGGGLAYSGDANNDGRSDLEDLNAVRNMFGTDYRPSSNPVPEPSSLALLALVAVGGVVRQRMVRR